MSSNLSLSDAQSLHLDSDKDEFISLINISLVSSAPVEEVQGDDEHFLSRGAQEPVLTVGQDHVENEHPKLFGEITECGVKTPNPQVVEAGLENLTEKDIQEVNNKDQMPDAVFPTLQPSNGSVLTVENVDEVNSEARDPQLVVTIQNPMLLEGRAQSPVLPPPAVSIKHQETSKIGVQAPRFKATSVNSSELSSTSSGPCFKILEVKPNPTFTNSQQSNPQARANDSVDGQSNTTTKFPQQVADANQGSWGYMDLPKIQLQYCRPTRTADPNGGDSLIKQVEAGQFPKYELLHKKPGHILYSIEEEEDLVAGKDFPHFKPQEQRNSEILGKGGNGKVVSFTFSNKEYAVKETRYRKTELNIWSKLQHPNIVLLKAVMIGEKYKECYQFMPRMSGDLRSIMTKCGDLRTLLEQQPQNWEAFLENTKYILAGVSKGLKYLDQHGIQHSDIKAANVLVQKECRCRTILHCECDNKYIINISDFDSARQTEYLRKPNQFSVCKTSMSDYQMLFVNGTKGHRAPEQFKQCPYRAAEYKKTLKDGKLLYDMEGPWCDIWSMGVMLLQLILVKGLAVREAGMLTNYEGNDMHPCIEPTSVTVCLNELLMICLDQPELNPLAKVASKCLIIDCTKRPTAEGILNIINPSDCEDGSHA